MTNEINRHSPKIEIIDHFDSLINRVDIDIEEAIGKYSEEQVLSELKCFEIEKRNVKSLDRFSLDYFDSTESEKDIQYRETVDEWPESMKVI
jgi:myo-inositol-1-phosphate synthase